MEAEQLEIMRVIEFGLEELGVVLALISEMIKIY